MPSSSRPSSSSLRPSLPGRLNKTDIARFRRAVYGHYRKHGRAHLPWRRTRDPYRILVSEVMLQQTQVDRVVPFFAAFLKEFPTVRALAEAPLSEVLRMWQGLGYNRRAKMLHEAAKAIVREHNKAVPRSVEELERLPGIGPYTARAVCAFAFDMPVSLIETNIRTVFIHHFFPRRKNVRDDELVRYIVPIQDIARPRQWYSALMDYGSYLKKTRGNVSRRSAHHVRQKAFKGSDREVRGAILRALARKTSLRALPFAAGRVKTQLAALAREGLISLKRGRYALG
jgi:A/G-specific adenine glycosylase